MVDVRAEIDGYIEGKRDVYGVWSPARDAREGRAAGRVPMDTGALGPAGGNQGSKGQGPKGGCWHCGGGHYARDCPHGGDRGAQTKGGQKGKKGTNNSKGKGKGPALGTDSFEPAPTAAAGEHDEGNA